MVRDKDNHHLVSIILIILLLTGNLMNAALRSEGVSEPAALSNDDESGSDVDEAALTRPIVAGEETEIIIDKGQTGLGLSIVGGSDTLLVCHHLLLIIRLNGSMLAYTLLNVILLLNPQFMLQFSKRSYHLDI